jgi:hypothetical protein
MKIKKYCQVNKFLAKDEQLYGISDEKGLFCLSRKFNSYVPCENMIKFNRGILGVSWSTISYF